MRTDKQFLKIIALTTLLYAGFTASIFAQNSLTIVNPETNTPVVLTTTPTSGEENVDLNSAIEITFSSEMDEATINGTTLLLHASPDKKMHQMQSDAKMDDQIKDRSATKDSDKNWKDTVNGTISYSDKVAVFTPDEELKEGTLYTFTITNDVKNLENVALDEEHSFSFSTPGTSDPIFSDKQDAKHEMDRNVDRKATKDSVHKDEKKKINLGKAGQFVILARTNINNESESRITGHTGEGSEENGMKKEKESSETERQKRIPGQLVGTQPGESVTDTPDVNEALEDMMNAYSDASAQNGEKAQKEDREQNGNEYGEKNDQETNDFTNHQNDHIPDEGLKPGVHQWNNSLNVHPDFTLSGSEDDVWLFKVTEDLVIDEDFVLTLSDGAHADNVFWYVEGEVIIGKNAQFEGIILSMNDITLEKGVKLNGRMFSQTSITLNDNTVTEPGNISERTSSTKIIKQK